MVNRINVGLTKRLNTRISDISKESGLETRDIIKSALAIGLNKLEAIHLNKAGEIKNTES